MSTAFKMDTTRLVLSKVYWPNTETTDFRSVVQSEQKDLSKCSEKRLVTCAEKHNNIPLPGKSNLSKLNVTQTSQLQHSEGLINFVVVA